MNHLKDSAGGSMGGTASQADWQRELRRAGLVGAALVGVLFIVLKVLRTYSEWPTKSSDNVLLAGILILGVLVPLVVLLGAVVAEKGSLKTKWFELDLKPAQSSSSVTVAIPANIGEPSLSIADSASNNILDGLRAATEHRVAVLDIGAGDTWWETRLFVLAAGGERLGNPELVVFIASADGTQDFVGWARSRDIRNALMEPGRARSDIYSDALRKSMAAAKEWRQAYELQQPAATPAVPPEVLNFGFPYSDPYVARPRFAPDPLLEEQLLGKALGVELENRWTDTAPGGDLVVFVTPSSLTELLGERLSQFSITGPADPLELAACFVDADADFIVETDSRGKFVRVLSTKELGTSLLRAIVRERLLGG